MKDNQFTSRSQQANHPAHVCSGEKKKKGTTEERGIWHFSRKTKVVNPVTSAQKKENNK